MHRSRNSSIGNSNNATNPLLGSIGGGGGVGGGVGGVGGGNNTSSTSTTVRKEPAIWAARHVEWPIPSSLSLSNYQKLLAKSRQVGTSLGITSATTPSIAGGSHEDGGFHHQKKDTTTTGGTAAVEEDNYFSGLIGRVLNNKDNASDTNPNEASSSVRSHHHHHSSGTTPTTATTPGGSSSSSSSSRPLRPPRSHCVATGNSWMVAALDCPPSMDTVPQQPTLRLVSRWNVRRTSGVDSWTALPPPIAGGDGRIQHVFCDPTGCHTLVSAKNGEAYYHHSSDNKMIQKLLGFGRNVDGHWPSHLTGVPATSCLTSSSLPSMVPPSQQPPPSRDPAVQTGISKGSYVTCVAWDRERGTEGSTKKILLGTSAGEIYEYALVSPNHSSENPEDVMDQPVLLHKLHSDAAVTGLAMERLRTGILILCCTSGRGKPTRFYTFYSANSSSLTMILADEAHSSVVDLPGSIDHADFFICNDHLAMRTAAGIYYGTIDRTLSGPAFAGGSMIVDSGILPYSEKSGIPVSLALTPHHIITLSESNEVRFLNRVAQKVIQKEKVDWISTSSSSAALDDGQMGTGELMMDIRRPDQVWLRKARSLVHISSSQEDRDIWKYTLFKSLDMASGGKQPSSSGRIGGGGGGMSEEEKIQESTFEQAKNLCNHPTQKAVVTAVRAEYHLSQGRAELAAKYFAQCPSVLEPFSDTAVRLALPMLKIDDPQSYNGSSLAREALLSNTPLITYLSDKMRVGKNNNDKMTCTMIGAWLTELHLHERESTSGGTSAKQSLTQFLSSNVNTMDSKTIMKLLMSHDVSAEECAIYAANSGDIATAFNAALRVGATTQDGVVEALKILNDAPFELAEPLYYKHALTLLGSAPVVAGKSFLSRYTHGLSPTRLLPAIMHYERVRMDRVKSKHAAHISRGKNPFGRVDEGKVNEFHHDSHTYADMGNRVLYGASTTGIFVDDPNVSQRYLEGVITLGCRSSAIYSFLISLYVKMDDEEPLYRFLSTHVTSSSFSSGGASSTQGFDGGNAGGPLDMSYALRTILRSGRHFRSAIKLYMGFGMRQQAVELGLKVDPALARELAQESVELEERRRLWLMIAKNAASEGVSRADADVVSKVVSVLKDCGPDVLSIEDVLPFLPDFAQIDQIKDEICEALTSYSSRIEGFLREMNECDETCDDLRGEISRLRTHRMEMRSDARCAYTGQSVLSSGEPFYVFPSGYVVLESALKREVMPCLNDKQKARVLELERELKVVAGEMTPGRLADTNNHNINDRVALQAEMDGLIAAECPLTGSLMVDSIDQSFPDSDEIEDILIREGRVLVGSGGGISSEAGTATV